MKLQLFAELLSAYAAMVTVGMALIELSSRSASKKAEAAIEVYADFLFVSQQLACAAHHVDQLSQHCKSMTDAEIKAFANSHLLNGEFCATIKRIESMSISSFNHEKAEGRTKSELIMDFIGSASNLVGSINTFFSSIAESTASSPDRIAINAQAIQAEYQQMLKYSDRASEILKKNLKFLRKTSIRYIIFLFTLTIAFVLVNYLLK